MLSKAGIDATTRPFHISIEEFSRLCDLYAEYCAEYNGLFHYYYRDLRTAEVQMNKQSAILTDEASETGT